MKLCCFTWAVTSGRFGEEQCLGKALPRVLISPATKSFSALERGCLILYHVPVSDGHVECGGSVEWPWWQFLQQKKGLATKGWGSPLPVAPAVQQQVWPPWHFWAEDLWRLFLSGSLGFRGDRGSSLFPVEVADFAGM